MEKTKSSTKKHLLHLVSMLLLHTISDHSAHALTFSTQLQLPNFFSELTSPTNKGTFSYTHLEGNGQLWQAKSGNSQVSVVVDPLASQLDFGIPWGYRANKVSLSESQTIDLICNAKPTHCLLTMGMDDHCHPPTIRKMMKELPDMEYIVAPSAEKKLLRLGLKADKVTVLKHGEFCKLGDALVTATEGALVGPPWQERELGFLLQLGNSEMEGLSIYYEPHADVVMNNIKNLRADIMVSPVTKQALPAQVPSEGQYTLVYGGDRTLEIADTLGASVVVPLGNGVLDIDGPLAGLVSASGGVSDFERLVEKKGSAVKVEKASPGVPITVKI
mmetsp:Transcript_24969/g.38754  ORF Transcript_24969/g.38754 Transcript_24969/m.38754 type:complete len:331 (+) Transcript_24969:180-1172(+)